MQITAFQPLPRTFVNFQLLQAGNTVDRRLFVLVQLDLYRIYKKVREQYAGVRCCVVRTDIAVVILGQS